MICFPNAKINVGLYVTGLREDGYHDISTLFVPVPSLCDILEILPSDGHTVLESSGNEIPGDPDDNIILKAYRILDLDFGLPKVKIRIHKVIPTGGGLGGGSSDGAFTLVMLNEMFNLGLDSEHLLKYAAMLGSDCPFFIINQPCFASGRGEILERADISFEEFDIRIASPGIHISTAHAYASIVPGMPEVPIREAVLRDIRGWRECLFNDFEPYAFSIDRRIRELKENFYSQGAVYASMTGSGSSVFGIFKK